MFRHPRLLLLAWIAASAVASSARGEPLQPSAQIAMAVPNSGQLRVGAFFAGDGPRLDLSGEIAVSRDCNFVSAKEGEIRPVCIAWAGTDNILHTQWNLRWAAGAPPTVSFRTAVFRFLTLHGLVIDMPGAALQGTSHHGRSLEVQVGGIGLQLPRRRRVVRSLEPRLGVHLDGGINLFKATGDGLVLESGPAGRLAVSVRPQLFFRIHCPDPGARLVGLVGEVGVQLHRAWDVNSVRLKLGGEVRAWFLPRTLKSLPHDVRAKPSWYGFVAAHAEVGTADAPFQAATATAGVGIQFGLPTESHGLPQDYYDEELQKPPASEEESTP